MKIKCLYDKLIKTESLKPHPKNRNLHPDKQVERLAEILEYQGWRYPVKVSKRSGFVTSGHGRILAAKLRGWKTVPVNYQEYESEEQEYADVQADNAIASWSELDFDNIRLDLEGMPFEFNTDLLGIKDFKVDISERDLKNTSVELNVDSFDNFEHQCPKCGFEWDDAKK